jgi:hypothetical protein
MSDTKITWYSMSHNLAVEQHEPVTLSDALKIVDRYLARGSGQPDSGEDAIAATMFGFSRSESDFIEICVSGPNRIAYKFEAADPNASWLRRLFHVVFQHEEELHSCEEVVQKVREFFTASVDEIRHRLET